MTTSALRRQVKNIVHNYSEAEIKVREATSNDPWGPPSSLMSEIADLTFNTVAFAEVMGMIWRRLNDSGKNWRHVYKALTLLDYLIKTGSEKVTHQCRENLYTIQTLKDFQYVDRDGKDQGINIREKVKQVMALLKDEERLKQERAHALQTKERMALEGMGSGSHQVTYGRRASPYGEDYGRARGSPSSFNSSSSSPRFASDLEQARPQTTGEEELQLQLALAMSREEAEKKPLPISSTDEERQLQLALALSKEEHEKEVRTWQGENSLQQRAVEETAQGREEEQEEDKMKKSQSSILELADIFGPAPAPSSHASADPWDVPDMKAKAEPVASAWAGAADPWVPVPDTSGEPLSQASASAQQTSAGPWDFPPSTTAASDPWGKAPVSSGFPPADPWGTASPPAPQGSGSTPAPDPWAAVPEQPPNAAPGGNAFDPFAKPPEPPEQEPSQPPSSAKSSSPVEPDPFGDLFPSTRQDGAKSFDLTNLADSLPESGKERKDCKTPEAFLGPAASSLVNLDSLVAPTPASKTRNPFLSGLSTPSPTNPFSLSEQPKPTLNQMRTSSPVPGLPAGHPANSMTYSASLPMPLSSVPSATAALPASASAFPQAGTFPELPGALPQPLLPLSGPPAPPSAPGGLNPFL
ncbi:epsin-3 isoform X1 [Chiroxiphia lanceolata]|uniref:Epsin-3 isoform X1 n=1 Tax=Lepidothrix coronata TaxID=321398 RepID=A0A6J0H0M3_9PASS|nr:PREDICTED: epsin-3 isoform X1 [Lepidothrix coronata]XP_017667585.1 PREDICTED: epsin-3 isoform X1 [Lepidothrix coronata]XP_032562522.1 epsin-3 isoform X1 [Chiroxiphia lanceolata]XP_032562523.1 epsin-3 isoform X1 [Chiroxiphia lanceolata]XP_051653946.1 epsin-3 isoform X1 [Manacus candei]